MMTSRAVATPPVPNRADSLLRVAGTVPRLSSTGGSPGGWLIRHRSAIDRLERKQERRMIIDGDHTAARHLTTGRIGDRSLSRRNPG
ncbi:hypothetical protein HerbRD11066_57150 [Herbidospora sp. RD11066]